jgi:ABC-type transport system substrate-binding protein
MSLAHDVDEVKKIFFNGLGMNAQTLIPPGIAGYDPNYKNPYAAYDVEKAKQFLAKAGYPGGKGLPPIKYETTANTTSRQLAELFAKRMKLIGVNVEISTNTWPELNKKIKTKQHMIYGMSWLADYPDAENFLQLLYGPNEAPGSNGANFKDPVFDEMYKTASVMQDSPQRTATYKKAAQYLAEKVPWILGIHRVDYLLAHGWLKNIKSTVFPHGNVKYYKVGLAKKKSLIKQF